MKFKDYFSRLGKQAKIGGEDFTKFIEAVPEGDIPDVVNALLEENFLTRDRASVDPQILKKVKAEVYNGIDADISALLTELSTTDQELINKEPNTHTKIKLLNTAYKNQYEELKKTAPDAVKINEEHVNTIKDLTARLEAEKKQKDAVISSQEKKVKEITDQKEKELKAYKIKNDLTGKLAQIEFAKEFTENPKVKDTVFNGILGNITKNELDYDEEGRIVVQDIVNGVPKPKFFPGTNDQVTIDKLLETETSPYLKRNNADEGVKKTEFKVQASTGKKTLREMQVAAAAE